MIYFRENNLNWWSYVSSCGFIAVSPLPYKAKADWDFLLYGSGRGGVRLAMGAHGGSSSSHPCVACLGLCFSGAFSVVLVAFLAGFGLFSFEDSPIVKDVGVLAERGDTFDAFCFIFSLNWKSWCSEIEGKGNIVYFARAMRSWEAQWIAP